MDYIEKEALSVAEAVFAAARALGIEESEAQVKVLSAPGARRVKVLVGKPGVTLPEGSAAPAVSSAPASHESQAPREPRREERREYSAGRATRARRVSSARPRTPAQAEAAKADLEKLLQLMATPGEVELKERAGNTV